MKKKLIFKFYSYSYGKLKKYLLKKIVALEGGQMYSQTLRKVYESKYKISIGYGSYGGCFNLKNYLPGNISFGNYCSIAQNIRIFRANHPKNTFTTHPLLYNPVAGYVDVDMLERPSLTIGHDVWIGEWAIILPGVKKIGNGSIIGAGSIVTKDVEPYSIVVGNPAKPIGKRFDNATIEILESEKWWLMDKSALIQNISKLNKLVNYNISS